jgi:hypothetical protein
MPFANADAIPGSLTLATAGLSMARPYPLQPGQVLYRFVDTRRQPPRDGANGPWWFEYEPFQQIKHFGLRHGYSLSYSARIHAAILFEWSDVNGVVRAQVQQPLQAWKGRGRQVHSTGADPRDLPRMTPMQSVNEVYQLFIPGLHPGGRVFQSAMTFLECLPA